MAESFRRRVESYVGATDDLVFLDEVLTQEARQLVRTLPVRMLTHQATVQKIGGLDTFSGLDKRVLWVERGNILCKELPPGSRESAVSSTSYHFATALSPAWSFEHHNTSIPRSVGIYPVSGALGSSDEGVIFYLGYPEVSHGDKDIAELPEEAWKLVVLAASTATIQHCIDQKRRKVSDDFSLSAFTLTATAPTAPTAPSLPVAPTAPTLPVITEYAEVDVFIAYEDVELAQSKIQEIRTRLEEFSMEVRLFSEETQQYSAGIQAFSAEYAGDVQAYSAEVQTFSIDVQSEVQVYSTNLQRIATELQKISAEVQILQSQYGQLRAEYQETLALLAPELVPES